MRGYADSMARFARCILMSAEQFKQCFGFVIKTQCGFECCTAVTIGTLFTKAIAMHIVFLVTTDACRGW